MKVVRAEALMKGIEVRIEDEVGIRSVRRVTGGLASLNVIVLAWWRVIVSIHLVSLLVKYGNISWKDGRDKVIDGII
jgi:hypothetical protein